jgi:enoyl-CoA hydratase
LDIDSKKLTSNGFIQGFKMMSFKSILFETNERVAIIRFNRPEALNTLNQNLIEELQHAVRAVEADSNLSCLIISGSDKAFAAGADIKEMADKSFADAFKDDFTENWNVIARMRKPTIAAVSGFALGGGCELAMQCDMVFAAENARFGQPEIKIGAIPGLGGTQRLTRAIGKARAMELILTGRMMDAQEAFSAGLITRVVPTVDLMSETLKVAHIISNMSLPSLCLAKEAINRSYESLLSEGLLFERRALHSLFATQDQKEGMQAFIEKRAPRFQNK